MKLTKKHLKQVIKEEMGKIINETSSEGDELIAKIGNFLYAMPRGPERDNIVNSIVRVAQSYHSSNAASTAAAVAAAKRAKRRLSDYSWAAEKNAGLDEPDDGADEYS